MLKKPDNLFKLVRLSAAASSLPLTVKFRLGVTDSKINAAEVVAGLVEAGAAAVTVHGRTATQRYTRPADWEMIASLAEGCPIPLLGNGDILTHFEARDRLQRAPHVAGLMAGVMPLSLSTPPPSKTCLYLVIWYIRLLIKKVFHQPFSARSSDQTVDLSRVRHGVRLPTLGRGAG